LKYQIGSGPGAEVREVEWWPPKVDDKLRRVSHQSGGNMTIKTVLAPLHVVAVFVHDGGHTKITCAEWMPGRRRWKYDVYDIVDADHGVIWPDGVEPTGQYSGHARALWRAKQLGKDAGSSEVEDGDG
jgi:hypothetical protein